MSNEDSQPTETERWRTEMQKLIRRKRADPSFIRVMPFPVVYTDGAEESK